MTMCVFALIASEFLPVSLLTPIAADLQVTQGMAGQGITISAVFAVLTSLSISTLAGKLDRKTLLLGLTLLMSLSGLIVGLAPNYLVYMVGRALIGVVVGGFWSMSAATAIRLVPADKVPKALAMFNSGNALATVVAAPLGSYLGAVIGWRGAFFCLVPIAILAFVWQALTLPAMHPEPHGRGSSPLGLLKRPPVVVGMLAVSVFFMGQFSLFTYLRPFLETVTHVVGTALSLTLLAMGVAGFFGTTLVGAIRKLGPHVTLVGIPLVMAAVAVALIFTGASLVAVVPLLAFWAFLAMPAPVGWWAWLARTLPRDAEAGGGLMVAVVQLAIGLGSLAGGLLYDTSGWQGTFGFSAVVLVVASLLAYLTARMDISGRASAPG
ncbi:MFS transporter [Xylophilus sp. Kf1]|nr:MFS transporter [Xylophilus sp. Kf1]